MATEISTASPTTIKFKNNMISAAKSEGPTFEPTKIKCRPPDNETIDHNDSPARKRQYQAYKKIMNKTRFNEVCNNLV
jgi:hypothetical protein